MTRGAHALALLALFAGARAQAAPPVHGRWHFDFGKWSLSILFERDERKGDTTRLLLEAPGGRFVFTSSQNTSGSDSTESIQLLRGGETFARRLLLSSFEGISPCSSVRAPDACVVFTGANGTLAAPISAFAGREGVALRERAGALVSPRMRDALFGLAPLLPSVLEFGSYSNDFLGLVWPERFSKERALKRGTRKPGCDFDAAFGFPCSDEDRAREAKRFDR